MMPKCMHMLLVLGCILGVRGDGKYWWMGTGAFDNGVQQGSGGNYQQGGGGYQQDPVGNSLQGGGGGQGQNFGLPATQGLSNNQGSCPAVNSIPPASQCAGRESNCWSAGQPDFDCIDNALCCFDGCANVCQGAGSITPVKPPNPRPNVQQQPRKPVAQPKPRPQARPKPRPQKKVQPQPARDPWPQQRPQKKVKPQPARDPWPQQTRQPVKNVPRQQQKQATRPRPVVNPPPQNNFAQGSCPNASPLPASQCTGRQSDCWSAGQSDADCIDNALCCFDGCANVCQGAGSRSPARPSSGSQSQPAETKPYVRCPSAMKCVPKINCDFEGVMRNQVFNLSPEMEMLRVPLIPCVNRDAGNVIDVCCRDPNYKDPWPDMQNGNGGNGGNFNAGQANIQINARNNHKKKKNGNTYG